MNDKRMIPVVGSWAAALLFTTLLIVALTFGRSEGLKSMWGRLSRSKL